MRGKVKMELSEEFNLLLMAFTFWITKFGGACFAVLAGSRKNNDWFCRSYCALAIFLIYFENYYKQFKYIWGL